MIATAVGCVALLCVVIWPFFGDYRTVVKIQGAGAAAFALYFLMLDSPTAAIACLISCSQLVISASLRDRYVVVRLYGASLILLGFLAVVTWHGPPSALALIGSILGSIARLQTSTSRMKRLFLIGAPFWLAHNLIVGAVFALGTDLVSIASNCTNMVRYFLRQRSLSSPVPTSITLISPSVTLLSRVGFAMRRAVWLRTNGNDQLGVL